MGQINNYLADQIGDPIQGVGNIGEVTSSGDASIILEQVLSTAIGVMTVVAFIWFAFKLIIGAIGIVNSGGDKAKIMEAKNNITFGVIGVVIVVSGIFIAELVAAILGLEGIFNIQFIVEDLIR